MVIFQNFQNTALLILNHSTYPVLLILDCMTQHIYFISKFIWRFVFIIFKSWLFLPVWLLYILTYSIMSLYQPSFWEELWLLFLFSLIVMAAQKKVLSPETLGNNESLCNSLNLVTKPAFSMWFFWLKFKKLQLWPVVSGHNYEESRTLLSPYTHFINRVSVFRPSSG